MKVTIDEKQRKLKKVNIFRLNFTYYILLSVKVTNLANSVEIEVWLDTKREW